jgi:DNA-binding transcriptional LysR family regulator
VAAPSYLAKRRAPYEPQAMRRHQALRFVVGEDVPRPWRVRIDGTWHNVPVEGKYIADDGEVVNRWAVAGLGIAYKSWLDVAHELRTRALLHVSPNWLGENAPLNSQLVGSRPRPSFKRCSPVAQTLSETARNDDEAANQGWLTPSRIPLRCAKKPKTQNANRPETIGLRGGLTRT